MFSANRLEYASAASKRNMNRDMTDRAIMTINEGRELLQLAPIEGGDIFILRGEYKVGHTLEEIYEFQKAAAEAKAGDVPVALEDRDPADVDRIRLDNEREFGDTDTGDSQTGNQERWDD
jgi:hypothetical protein